LVNSPPFAQLFGNTGASNGLSTLQKPFPTTTLGFALRTPASQLTDRAAGPVFRIPTLQQWNINTQFSLSPSLTVDLGYAGSHGNHLLLAHGFNQPLLASPGNPVNCGLPGSPAALGVSEALFAGLGIDGAGCVTINTSLNAKFRVPFLGETPTALMGQEFIGASWYNSLQTTLREKTTRGLAFQFAYTFSKAESNTAVYNDQNNLSLDWGRASFDRRHRFIANYSYELPGVQTNGVTGFILKGWSVSGIVVIQSGLPMTLTDINGGSAYGFAGNSTVSLCPNATYASLATAGSDQSRLNAWFNKTAICHAPVIGFDGSTGYGTTGINIITGPGQFNTDFSLGKVMRVGNERGELAFRVEFYNALNHPQFSNPGTAFGASSFGVITQTSVAPRLIQFGIKYLF
jgi:hypothetical protein